MRFLVFIPLLFACSKDAQSDGCIPGETRLCECSPHERGVAVCLDNGSSWQDCDCTVLDPGSEMKDTGDSVTNGVGEVNSDSDSDGDADDDVRIGDNALSCDDQTKQSHIAELEMRGVNLDHDCN